jgi:hypothetical protein
MLPPASRPVAVWHEHCLPEPTSYASEGQLPSAIMVAVECQAVKALPWGDMRVQVYHPHVVAGELAYTFRMETVMPRSSAMRV